MIKNIIFDFDGVILDSVPVKTEAYRRLFTEFDPSKVEQLVTYHEENGGISRYEKVKYFFNVILNQEIEEKKIEFYAQMYSQLTKEELCNTKYIIEDTLEFIRLNYMKYNMHIASGADEYDLKYICQEHELLTFFLSIHGSPKKKNDIVQAILKHNQYNSKETILIGDSINDHEAAKSNQIIFYGYNNKNLKVNNYINDFRSFQP